MTPALYVDAPPLPPRPHNAANNVHKVQNLPKPPIPPLPPDFRPQVGDYQLPHRTDSLIAPRPQHLNPNLPADMARALDEQVVYGGPRFATPQPPAYQRQMSSPAPNFAPGFVVPGPQPFRGPSPAPPPHRGAGWGTSMPMARVPSVHDGGIVSSMAGVSLNDHPMPRIQSMHGVIEHAQKPAPPPTSRPSLVAPLPTVASLQASLPSVRSPNTDLSSQVAWIRDVLFLAERESAAAEGAVAPATPDLPMGADIPSGPAKISDPALRHLADTAVPLLISIVPALPDSTQDVPPFIAEALYLRAALTASGAFPAHIAPSPRNAFREFEAAGRAGHAAAWFRLGRDYESFGDAPHARQCFERGLQAGDEACTYRMGTAHLLGQLGLPAGPQSAVPLLHRAATLASVAFPQSAYAYALLLLDAVPQQVSVAPLLFAPFIPKGSAPAREARRHLERAAFLHLVPAQRRLGRAYEFAEAPCPYDPALSVQYYSLASQQGDAEADMALSKWFLCGADGADGGAGAGGPPAITKDELLARTFAEKAARKGLPSAEFAMGYYCEVGIGAQVDVRRAVEWYEKAAAHGNTDAAGRLSALAGPSAHGLSRQEHDTLTQHKLVRTRTQARQRSDAAGVGGSGGGGGGGGGNAPPPGYAGPELQQPQQYDYQQQLQQPAITPRQSSLPPGRGAGLPAHPSQHVHPPQPQPSSGPNGYGFGFGPGPAPAPAPPAQRFPADRPRYSLVDPGAAGAAPPAPASASVHPPYGSGPGRRVPSASSGRLVGPNSYSPGASPRTQAAALPPAASPKPSLGSGAGAGAGTKYSTFADMGIQGSKAEDKECVIM